DRQRDRARRHQNHPAEDDRRRGEVPQRIRGKERRVEDGHARAVQRVRRELVVARHAQLAEADERRAGDEADRRANGRLQPAVLDRVAEKEERRENQRDAGNPGEELHPDQRLPVERRLGWAGRDGWGRWGWWGWWWRFGCRLER